MAMLRLLQKNGELKRLAIINVYETMSSEAHFQAMCDHVRDMTWRDFVDDVFHDLEYEAARRRLQWDLYGGASVIALSDGIGVVDLDGPRRGSLERKIVGAIRDSISSHGPVTHDTAPSAAKRVIGAIKCHNKIQ